MQPAIIDRGRGPEIAGSRITVYDVLAETQAGQTPEQLAADWDLRVEQIQCALQYIEEHKEHVLREWAEIKARNARGNPPEIQAKLDATHAKYAPLWEALRKKHAEEQRNGDGRPQADASQLVADMPFEVRVDS